MSALLEIDNLHVEFATYGGIVQAPGWQNHLW